MARKDCPPYRIVSFPGYMYCHGMPSSQFVTFRMLSVRQPWADFLVADEGYRDELRRTHPELAESLPKDVENRGWAPGGGWRGTLLVHAVKNGFDVEAMVRYRLDPAAFVYGAVVGVVQVTDVVDNSVSRWAESGRKHWLTASPARLRSPVECAGFQGLREPTPPVLASVLTQWEHQQQMAAW
jgi:hypothetical protein